MTFGRPDLLWLALLAVPVVVFHLVRRRRRRVRVPALLLWERVITGAPRRFGPAWLTSLLSLLLLLAALGAGVIAAADPSGGSPPPPPRPLLLALGGSARMQGARFEEAVRIAGEEIGKKAPADPVTIVLISGRPRILAAAETDPDVLFAALEGAAPALVEARWELAEKVVTEVLGEGGRAVLIGVAPSGPEGAVLRPVSGRNVGITAFDVRVKDEEVEIYLATVGAGGTAATGGTRGTEVVVTVNDLERARTRAEPELFLVLPREREGGVLRVSLSPGSGPSFDDSVEATITPRHELRIGITGPMAEDPFLAAVLEILSPMLDLERSGRLAPDADPEVLSDLDVVIHAGPHEGPVPPGRWLFLGPPPAGLLLEPLPPAPASPVWSENPAHPVTEGVDPAEVQVVGAIAARLPDGAVPLLSVPEGAVAAAGEAEGRRWIWVGLGADSSTLPFTAAWPVLLRNALRWFGDLRADLLPPSFRIGEGLSPAVRFPAGAAHVVVTGPDGEREIVRVVAGGFLHRPGSPEEGEVTVALSGETWRTHGNVILPEESAAEPIDPVGPPPPDRGDGGGDERPLAPWFALAAAALLVLEGFLRG